MVRSLPRLLALLGLLGLTGAAVVVWKARGHEHASFAAPSEPAPPSASPIPYASAPIPDARLASAIEECISRDPLLHSRHVEARVDNGVVTLSGTVATLGADWRARRLVSDFRGATSVADGIVVDAPARSDPEIVKDVADALQGDPATGSAKVRESASGGKLTLSGTADSYSQRDLLAEVAAHVRGVRQVVMTVTVRRATVRSDDEIAAGVDDRLRGDARLDGTNVAAAVVGGDAILHGVVGSLAQRDAAIHDTLGAGAAKVDAQALQVDWREGVKLRIQPSRPSPTDAEITGAVSRALSSDVTLYGQLPAVHVEKGVVTLTGSVVDFRADRAARRDASQVSGAWHVADQMSVVPAKWESDATIETQVLRGIYEDVAAPDSRDAQVLTRDARVTLQGAVASEEDSKIIQEDAEEVPGVVAVQNDLKVAGYGPHTMVVAPESLRHAIVEAIFWDPRMGDRKVDVTVAPGGDVTLDGLVDTWREARAAGDDAVLAGAARVTNLVRLANPSE